MSNPSTSRIVSGQQIGTNPQGSLNNPSTANRESYNTFNRSRKRLSTQRFDQVMPMYCQAQIEGDVSRLQVSHDLRSYTLKSPLLSDVQLHRTFFQVPWSAIMPRTWDKIYRQPIKGEDIEYTDVAPCVLIEDFVNAFAMPVAYNSLSRYKSLFTRNATTGRSEFVVNATNLSNLPLRPWLCCQLGLSRNSLVKNLGISLPYEKLGDGCHSLLVAILRAVADSNNAQTDGKYTGTTCLFYNNAAGTSIQLPLNPDTTLSQIEAALDAALRDPSVFYVSVGQDEATATLPEEYDWLADLSTAESASTLFYNKLSGMKQDPLSYFTSSTLEKDYINLMPVAAYQCILAQYYSNPNIDEIYTASMYLEQLYTAFDTAYSKGGLSRGLFSQASSFTLNGIVNLYDAFAGRRISCLFKTLSVLDGSDSTESYTWSLASAIFSIGASLKRGDYFVNARTQPLAVGDVSVTVSDNKVSAIDMNRSMWVQRFLNAVNRASQNIYEYIQAIAGVTPERIAPQPNFICDESFRIGNMEVENTADEQGKIVTLFRNAESRYMYEVYVDEPSWIIGVNTFNMDYSYSESSDRTMFIKDRLEWFNSFMQHAGDQEVLLRELYVDPLTYIGDVSFGYQLRYAEFKNSISQATGGFLDESTDLDSYAAIFSLPKNSASWDRVISSQFIRNTNLDFDKFYSSLTGTNASNRFHFILAQNIENMVNSKQQAYPTLL